LWEDGILRPNGIRPVTVSIPFCGAERDHGEMVQTHGRPITNRPQDAILPHNEPAIHVATQPPSAQPRKERKTFTLLLPNTPANIILPPEKRFTTTEKLRYA